MSADRCEALVVGAGFSGLAAGLELAAEGIDVILLEARDRVGGRSKTETRGGLPIEGGGQFVGPRQSRVLSWAERYGVEVFEAYDDGDWLLHTKGGWLRQTELWPELPQGGREVVIGALARLDEQARQVPLAAPWTAPLALEWDRLSLGAWLEAEVADVHAREFLRVATEILFAADWSEVSLLHALLLLHACGGAEAAIWTAQALRVSGGTHGLAEHAAEELGNRVRLGSEVVALEHDVDRVIATLASGSKLTAQRAVVALPPALAGRLRYSPPLSARRDRLFQRMPNGVVVKSVAVYDEPFWRADGLCGVALSPSNVVSWIYDNCWQEAEVGMLVGFTLGRRAAEHGALPAEARRAEALGDFASAFGGRAADPVDFVDFVWSEEAYSRGCYSGYGPPGFWTLAGAEIRESAGPIHWAGTEAAEGWMGFLEGAIGSGERSGREVLASLGRG